MTNRPLIGIQLGDNPEQSASIARLLRPQITLASLEWHGVEREPGVYDTSAADAWWRLRDLLGWLPELVWKAYPLHMNARSMPADLAGEPLTSGKILDRFDGYIAAAAKAGEWDANRSVVIVGNEVDWFATANPDEAGSVVEFLTNAGRAVKRHAPSARVVHALQHSVLSTQDGREFAAAVTAECDVIALNWYDLGPIFTLPEPADFEQVLTSMETFAAGKPVLITEIGTPSGVPGASEQTQAGLVKQIFDVFRTRTRETVEGCVWLTTDDWPAGPIREYVDAQFPPELASNDNFFSYLISNGLRTAFGERNKPAFDTWVAEMETYA